MIFLDTDTLSYFLSGNTAVIEKVNETVNNNIQICLTGINVYEFLKGLRFRSKKDEEREFNNFLKDIGIFHLDNNAIQTAADIYANLRKRGITVGDADILIASIVMVHNGKLITNNTRHYKNINGLIIENWYIWFALCTIKTYTEIQEQDKVYVEKLLTQ